jgi:hypothetical protein
VCVCVCLCACFVCVRAVSADCFTLQVRGIRRALVLCSPSYDRTCGRGFEVDPRPGSASLPGIPRTCAGREMIRQGVRACVRLCLLFVVRCLPPPCFLYLLFVVLCLPWDYSLTGGTMHCCWLLLICFILIIVVDFVLLLILLLLFACFSFSLLVRLWLNVVSVLICSPFLFSFLRIIQSMPCRHCSAIADGRLCQRCEDLATSCLLLVLIVFSLLHTATLERCIFENAH